MKKILLVDDNVEIRELIKATLDSNEFSIVEAVSGEESVSIAARERPDLIIMDIMMPGKLNGIDAIRAIKQNEAINDCPVIILSGSGEQVTQQHGIEAGAITYFRKPFSPLDLIARIEETLGIKID